MGESIDVWREFFRTTDTDVFEFIDKAITIAALDCPKDFLSRRGSIAERLFSCETTRGGGDCALATKESKENGSTGDVTHDVVSINYDHGEAETFSDIEEKSQVVPQVLRIKKILDNSRHESDSELYESLRRLQSISITMDILEQTKIGVSVNSLRRNCGSKKIAQFAHNITMGWKAMVEEICRSTVDVTDPRKVGDGAPSIKDQNVKELRQEKHDFSEAGSLANKNRRMNTNQHKGIVKPNLSSNTNPRTTPASNAASWKFEKEKMLQSQGSNGSAAACKRPLAKRQDMIECWNEVVADMKYEATKRKMRELYQKEETNKRRRTVEVLDPCDLPKMAASHKALRAPTAKARSHPHKAPCATTAKACKQKVISRSRVTRI